MFEQQRPNMNDDKQVAQISDTISSINWSPRDNHIIATSWDKQIYCWEIAADGSSQAKVNKEFPAPLLTASWHSDGSKVYVAGCDNKAYIWDLASNQTQQIAEHAAPIKYCKWIADRNLLLTTGWDNSIKYWDGNSPNPVLNVQLAAPVSCADVNGNLCVVAMTNRNVNIYNLSSNPQKPYRVAEQPLKFNFPIQSIACFPDKKGFAVGSIEGRVGIQHVDSDKSKDFAFKCHRMKSNIYAVNSISFHPRYGSFATCGGDGIFHFWDKQNRQRLQAFKQCNMPITCGSFNTDGSIFAYALGYDWSRGAPGYNQNNMRASLYVHGVADKEVKPRPRR
eukprot:TRINITY_DN7835_c0_g1_i2.p2 TRINITY_DN7835_c0_g1~~TRINITY_DN7835_c0_g1_i2.p2  ORF type:complete len:336 (+),score=62.82 TRINITY_DN7835_c0_g1_i2:14-1021(+)